MWSFPGKFELKPCTRASQQDFELFERLSKEIDDLWKSRTYVYTGMGSNMDVSKSVGIFKSKVETFLKDFQGQLSNYEISFSKERLHWGTDFLGREVS